VFFISQIPTQFGLVTGDCLLLCMEYSALYGVQSESNTTFCSYKLRTSLKTDPFREQPQFEDACTMANGRFNDLECAESVLVALSLDVDAIRACVGDVTADVVNDVLENEQEMQLDDGRRGDINILPTVVINDRQVRVAPWNPNPAVHVCGLSE